jgi:hypothetical protein
MTPSTAQAHFPLYASSEAHLAVPQVYYRIIILTKKINQQLSKYSLQGKSIITNGS